MNACTIKDVMRACDIFSYDAEGKFIGLNRACNMDGMTESPLRSVATGQSKEYIVRVKDQDVVVHADEKREEVWAALIEQHCNVIFIHPFKN